MARRNSPFFTFLRAIFSRPFRLSLAPAIFPWVSEDGVTIALFLKKKKLKNVSSRHFQFVRMVFECKIIGAVFLILKDPHRAKNTKVKTFTYLQAFCHPGQMCPHTPTPKCSCTLAALNINLLAEQMLNERYSAGYQAPVFGLFAPLSPPLPC